MNDFAENKATLVRLAAALREFISWIKPFIANADLENAIERDEAGKVAHGTIVLEAFATLVDEWATRPQQHFCVYCQAEFLSEDGERTLVIEHVKTCEKNPFVMEIAKLRSQRDEVVNLLMTWAFDRGAGLHFTGPYDTRDKFREIVTKFGLQVHRHERNCFDDAGPGAGGVNLICGKTEGVEYHQEEAANGHEPR